MKRLAVFVHFDIDNIVDKYVYYYIKELKSVADEIVFVTTSQIGLEDQKQVKKIANKLIIRENVGYDFMSYKVGLNEYDLNNFDEVIICNDSVYGPLYSFKKVFDTMVKKECDFWGITLNKEPVIHLQSYFVVFKKRVLLSECFSGFWNNVDILHNKVDVVNQYEWGLSQALLKCGFKLDFLVKVNILSAITYYIIRRFSVMRRCSRIIRLVMQEKNPSLWYWDYCIEKTEMPFLKTSLLKKSHKRYLSHMIRSKKIILSKYRYPFELIENYIIRHNKDKLN